jgi:hypothetical protein
LLDLATKFGICVGPGSGNKRDEKASEKLQEQMEKESVRSVESMISRNTAGRFEGKYKVGDKTASGALIKEVIESDWKFTEKDKKGNSYYKCLKCDHAPKARKDHRKTHSCK